MILPKGFVLPSHLVQKKKVKRKINYDRRFFYLQMIMSVTGKKQVDVEADFFRLKMNPENPAHIRKYFKMLGIVGQYEMKKYY